MNKVIDNKDSGALRDILVFMSDQHTPYYSGFYGDCCVDTPNLNRLCKDGVAFDECYTVSPLCGPARISLLCSKRPASTGLFHRSILPDTTPTFLHYLVEQGYETVLIGRMHFIGADQHHGFTKHIAADMTPVTWNYQFARDELRRERGVFVQTDTFSGKGAASVAGWLAAGDDIVKDRRISEPVGIMDIGPTILEYTGAKPMYTSDGVSVAAALKGGAAPEHPVYSEFMERTDGKPMFIPYSPEDTYSHGFMFRHGDYKYVTYEGCEAQDMLFNIAKDPQERMNLAGQEPELLEGLRLLCKDLICHEKAMENFRREDRTNDLMSKYEWVKGNPDQSMRWKGSSEAAGRYPEICVKNPAYFPEER